MFLELFVICLILSVSLKENGMATPILTVTSFIAKFVAQNGDSLFSILGIVFFN